MAGADYARCENCGGKAFYDADCTICYQDAAEQDRAIALCQSCAALGYRLAVLPPTPEEQP